MSGETVESIKQATNFSMVKTMRENTKNNTGIRAGSTGNN